VGNHIKKTLRPLAQNKTNHTKTENRTIALHHPKRASNDMSTPEIINIEQTIDIMEDRRVHRIPLMSGCRNVSSRKDLIVLIKILLDDLENNDPVLRARIAQVRNAVSFSTIPCRFDVISRAPFSLLGRS
jgi:hypothetical protein